MNVRAELDKRISAAMQAAGAGPDAPALVAVSSKPQFGDFQANGCMAAAKTAKTNPRAFAETVLEHLDLSDMAAKVELAGPGFLNIFLTDAFLSRQCSVMALDEQLGVPQPDRPQTIVADYSSPNLAKEMHVGHLRSTIIGDAVARVLEFLGHKVIRQNHVGDWGTQFGMLIAYMDRVSEHGSVEELKSELADLETFYKKAATLFRNDPAFAEDARQAVVKLQGGDEHCRLRWEHYVTVSLLHCQRVYGELDVDLTMDDVHGESKYNDDLPRVLEDLDAAGLLAESEGAQCVFLEEFKNKDGEPLPVIVKKSDGAYLYATTDLAAIRHRSRELRADRVLYFVDARQSLHFQQIFAVARRAGFCDESVSLEHVPFGMMLGKDGRPFKTRDGGTVKLMDLLEESKKRAFALVGEKNADLPDETKHAISRVVGIGALKYADLSQNRTSDYIFSWEKMITLEGNTAPYMQYAYARVRSIFRKAEDAGETLYLDRIVIAEPAEHNLAVKLLQFADVLETVGQTCQPHLLCGYLFELAGAFMGFYENCPVLKAEGETRNSRLALCGLVAETIRVGLALLGIRTIEQM